MTDQDNLNEIVELRPDYIGFIFYSGSRRYVGDLPEISLFTNVPDGIIKTGVFVNENPGIVNEKSEKYGLQAIQLHGNESAEYCYNLYKSGLTVIKAFGIISADELRDLEDYVEVCDFFLFDTKTGGGGGSGMKFNWDLLNYYNHGKPFFISGGIGPGDIESIRRINNKNLYGIDVNSRFETSPGIKDKNNLEAFIKEIKSQNDEL